MKKRAQRPDAYTFTILFRGFSWYPQFPQSAPRALSIYQSMFSENSPVRPSIIHTNAVLKVCALAHDVEALLGIAAELPTHGTGAPNNLTFTTILNAIRSKAIEDTEGRKGTSREEHAGNTKVIALALQQGRRLWVEVRQRWMSGDLRLDEEFVCAMGRLLLLGNEARDHDDVLSLLEQTMGIPRQVARVADSVLQRAEESSGPAEDPESPLHSLANVEPQTLISASDEQTDIPKPPSDPFAPHRKTTGATLSNVRPGRNTLSLVLDACIRLKSIRAAQNYWGLLTSPDGYHQIIPDSENYHMYLRLLRLQRSSKLAVELVAEMKSGQLTGKAGAVQIKTFRIALSSCVRDIKNRNSIVHAEKLVRMMTDTLTYPDAKALSMYLQVALGQKPQDWRVIMGVIRGTEAGVRNLRSLLAYDPAGPLKQSEEDISELVKGLIGAFDVVLDLGNEEMSGEEKRRCREQKHMLAAFVTRMHQRHVAERKSLLISQEKKDELIGAAETPFQDTRSDKSEDHQKVDEEGEAISFEGERDDVLPLEGEPKMEWTMKRRVQKWQGKKEREMKDRMRVDRVMIPRRFQGERNEQRA